MSNKEHFIELVDKFINGTLTEEENNALKGMLDQEENDAELDRILKESYEQSGDESFWNEKYREVFVSRLLDKAGIDSASDYIGPMKPAHRIHFLKTAWFRYAAAIILTVGLGTVAYLLTTKKDSQQTLANGNKRLQTDIPPGGDKAVLTLADGSNIILDNAANGNIADQGGVQVVKLANGQIAYDLRTLSSKDVMWNTMSTPRGGQYQVTLPDGTKVWLNAASSITFPTAFTGKERNVKVTGEAYFEVTRNKQQPFIVDINGKSAVQVLGTEFNINSYGDEASIKTTLIEGSVKIFKADQSAVLKPGQQAVQAENRIVVNSSADLDKVLAWKNGLFNFDEADLYSVMRQLERWYDIDVQYRGSSSTSMIFQGKMYRNANLSDVLEMLKKMGVNFQMDGKTLIVL